MRPGGASEKGTKVEKDAKMDMEMLRGRASNLNLAVSEGGLKKYSGGKKTGGPDLPDNGIRKKAGGSTGVIRWGLASLSERSIRCEESPIVSGQGGEERNEPKKKTSTKGPGDPKT